MAFVLPDLVIESAIRDGVANLRNNPKIIEDVFSSLTRSYASRKYGNAEIERIKTLILKKEINVVHSFHEVQASTPCYSIQLGNDEEDRRLARLDDFEQDLITEIVDPEELSELVKISNVIPTGYDQISGQISIDDSVNLADVYANLIFVDASGVEHKIIGSIINDLGSKMIGVAPNSEVDISNPGLIKSSLNYTQNEIRGVTHNVSLTIGVHAKNALTVKYLYVLLKYFLLSRKADLIRRCFFVSSLTGSDFTRDLEYQGDIVFNRFLTITGKVEDSWNSDDVELIDSVDTIIEVQPSRLDEFPQTDATLGREDQTIQINEDSTVDC